MIPDTKVIAVGITDGVNHDELYGVIASSPENVILVPEFKDLKSVEKQLREDTCGKHVSFAVVLNYHTF